MKKLFVGLVLIAFITIWALFFGYLGGALRNTHPLIELVFYVVAGMGWAFPLIPFMRWASKP